MGVGLPNIDFGAATAIWSDTGIGIVGRWLPALDITLATNKLEITSALSVAILQVVISG